MDTAGNLVNESHPRHARYHAQCIIALLLEDYFFTYDEKDPWNQMPSWLSELLLNMSKIENLQEGYERMCELAPCSPSHLCRLMKQISGKTPTQYINQERLKYAVYLLAQTDREILDICECCGFSNVSHFYHLFREQFGCHRQNSGRQCDLPGAVIRLCEISRDSCLPIFEKIPHNNWHCQSRWKERFLL